MAGIVSGESIFSFPNRSDGSEKTVQDSMNAK